MNENLKLAKDRGLLAQEKIWIRRLDADGNILEEQELVSYRRPTYQRQKNFEEEGETNDC